MLYQNLETNTLPDLWQLFLWLVTGVFVVATMVQIIYLWKIYGQFARLPGFPIQTGLPEQPPVPFLFKNENLPPVSVVICARNEAENLKKNLPKIFEQDYPNFEVLVVDDDSRDETSHILEGFLSKNENLRVFRLIGKLRAGKKDALTDGVSVARNEHIILTDADCQPATNQWLRQMAANLTAKPGTEILLGYGGYRRDDSVGFLNKWIRWETVTTALQYFSFSVIGRPFMGVGRNLAWKKSLFRAAGGFESHLHIPSGDDDLFVNASARPENTAICFSPETFTFSEGKKTWKTYFQQKRRHLGASWGYRWEHIFLLGIWSLSFTLHYMCMFLLLIFNGGMVLVFSLFFMRMIFVALVYVPVLRKFREEQLIPFIPIFDFFMAVFYLAFAPILLFFNNKSHSWT